MRSSAVAFILAILATSIAAPTGAQDCASPPIDRCPRLFVEKCDDDAGFRSDNGPACLRLDTQRRQRKLATDPPECNPSDACKGKALKAKQEQCLATPEITQDIEGFLKSCGLPDCPDTMKRIAGEFDGIAQRLKEELAQYKGILRYQAR